MITEYPTSKLPLRYPTVDGVVIIHEDIMQRMGESGAGFLYEGGLPYCIETARDLYDDPNLRNTIIWKAAYYMWCLVRNHPFVDGNKRTAFQTADVFLRANSHKLVGIDPYEAISILNGVAVGQISLDDLASWVEKHLSLEG